MSVRHLLVLSIGLLTLVGCSVKSVVKNEYQITQFSNKHYSKHEKTTLLVAQVEAISGYDTEKMLYVKKPFEIESFAQNAWMSPPGDMIYPLVTQSLQRSGYFFAVATSPYSEATDYRLDTQLMRLQQNFLKKPSQIELVVKVVLTDVRVNKVVASSIISRQVPCVTDSPYGGVLAANQATEQLTSIVTDFVLAHVK